MPTRTQFEETLNTILYEARANGRKFELVCSSELHMRVGGYQGSKHRMPLCSSVMRVIMQANDLILRQPPKGNGATLEIEYSTVCQIIIQIQ